MNEIEELIEHFRRSGGIFKNAALGYREQEGFYIYTLDSKQDTVVSCPAHLLVDIDDVDADQNGLFITDPDKYKNSMDFLGKYFEFHFNNKMLDRYIKTKQHIDSLSNWELTLISGIYPPELLSSTGETEQEFAKRQIFNCHKIEYFGKEVLMPFVTFLNHAKNGIPYNISKDSISVLGKFNDEVFANYHMGDTISIAGGYGFVTDTRFAYSLSLRMTAPNGTLVVITRNLDSTLTREGFRWPLVRKYRNAKGHNVINLSWFPLYFERDALYPAKIAQMAACETGISADVLLNNIFRFNLNALVPAAFQLRESKNPYAQLVASAAQRQLEVISGTRK